MNTDLKDIKKRNLKLGDTIAMCGWNYDLRKFGKAGKEYWFNTGKVYFSKGRVQWTGFEEFDYKIYDEKFLIIKRGKKCMVKVDKKWDWKAMDIV